MVCKNCFHENEPNEKVCANCGTPLVEEETEVIAEEVVENAETADAVNSGEETIEEVVSEEKEAIETVETKEVAEEDIAETEEEVISEDIAEDEEADEVELVEEVSCEKCTSKNKSKLIAFSGLIALIIIAIGLWAAFTGIFAPEYDIPVDRSKYAVSYIKDFSLYQKPDFGSVAKVSEPLVADTSASFAGYSNIMKQSKDGKILYFLENYDQTTFSGTLYVTYNGKNKTKIDEGVLQDFIISENGKTVVYMKDFDISTSMGSLHYYTKGTSSQIISNSSMYGKFLISRNGKAITYADNIDQSTGAFDLCVAKVGKEPIKVDESVYSAINISDKGEVLYLKTIDEATYTCELYRASYKKAPEFISAGVADGYVLASKFSNKFGYVATDEEEKYNFYVNSGNSKSKLVMSDLMGFFRVDIENEKYLLAKIGDDSTSVNPDMFLQKGNGDAKKIAQDFPNPQYASASYDFKTIYYLNDIDEETNTGKLHIRKEYIFGFAKDEIIAEGVTSFVASPDGKAALYTTATDVETNTSTLNAYSKGKSKVIAENVYAGTYRISQNGKKVIYIGDMNTENYTGTLYITSTTGSAAPKAIDTEVFASFYARSEKSVIYHKNIDSETDTAELYIWKGRGTPEKIDTGVATVMFE